VTALDVVLGALALLTAAAGALAVTGQRVVHAALWLVVALGGLAGVYLLLGAEVVALVQLLVYVGAVVVLVLFALMLTRAPTGPAPARGGPDDLDSPRPVRWLAAVTGLATGVLVTGTLVATSGAGALVQRDPSRGRARPLGESLFGSWVLPFELVSVLLLAALVAAVAVSRGRDDGTGPGR
jgi:NADH-quinone oxidoreductase subunit J